MTPLPAAIWYFLVAGQFRLRLGEEVLAEPCNRRAMMGIGDEAGEGDLVALGLRQLTFLGLC